MCGCKSSCHIRCCKVRRREARAPADPKRLILPKLALNTKFLTVLRSTFLAPAIFWESVLLQRKKGQMTLLNTGCESKSMPSNDFIYERHLLGLLYELSTMVSPCHSTRFWIKIFKSMTWQGDRANVALVDTTTALVIYTSFVLSTDIIYKQSSRKWEHIF